MEAKDLMIGDLVRVNRDVCIKNDTIVRVCGIDATNRLVGKGLEGSATCVPVDDIDFYSGGIWVKYLSPVPLTPEILEKNGFVINSGPTSWKFETEREDLIDIYGCRDYHLSINIEDTHGSGKGYRWMLNSFVIHYVHELQHALRLFRIEKEIVVC